MLWLFDLDRWNELFANLARNRLRTLLTAFGIYWGIFMLVILLGAGNGLRNGVTQEFAGDAVNNVWIWAGQTSQAYRGFQPGRLIEFTLDDYETLRRGLRGIRGLTAIHDLGGNFQVHYRQKKASFNIKGVHPPYARMENAVIQAGRFLNERDILEKRQVVVLGELAVQELFGDPKAAVVGKSVLIKGVPFLVIGTFTDQGGEGDMRRGYIPITTLLQVFQASGRFYRLAVQLNDHQNGQEVSAALRLLLARRHACSPTDRSAIGAWAADVEFRKIMGLFASIELFVWLVGLGTLVAGVVGVGNVMLITVRERTKEIGIRKALGATPFWVVSFIIQEAVFITTAAGLAGIASAVGLLAFVRSLKLEAEMFKDPGVDLGVALAAAGVLVVAGAVAGAIPALRAAAIQPIEALRYE
jgi:putative ABC transport system permease protein